VGEGGSHQENRQVYPFSRHMWVTALLQKGVGHGSFTRLFCKRGGQTPRVESAGLSVFSLCSSRVAFSVCMEERGVAGLDPILCNCVGI